MTAVDEYGVIGHPVAHSLSPALHALFAAEAHRALLYRQHDAPPERFAHAVRAFAARGGRGLNVTLPHKRAALELADAASPREQQAGAANWLRFGDDGILADNTDGAGLVRDLREALHVELAGARILLLGAGGAAAGVLGALLECRPARLCIANRTPARAEALARRFAPAEPGGLDAFDAETFDLIVSATSAGVSQEEAALPAGLRTGGAVCYDLMYGRPTPFLRWARAQGSARLHDGLGMLIEQAAESFALWHGARPDTAAARTRLGAARADA